MQSAAIRTVSATIEPVPFSRAMRRAEVAQTAEVAEEMTRARQGFVTTARNRKRAQAVSRREEELADGHAEMRFAELRHRLGRRPRGPRARLRPTSSTPPSWPASSCSGSTGSRTRGSPTRCRSAGGSADGAARRAARALGDHRPLPGRLPLPRPGRPRRPRRLRRHRRLRRRLGLRPLGALRPRR